MIIRPFPIALFGMSHIVRRVIAADFVLAINDVLIGQVGVFNHVVHNHVGRRPAGTGFAVKMEPGVSWQGADESQEGVDFARRRPEMIRISQADVVNALALGQFPFRLDVSDRYDSRMNGQIAFPLVVDKDVRPQSGLQALLFIRQDFGLGLADIAPVVTAVPADCRTIEEAMRFLPQVDIVNRAFRLFPQRLDQGVELAGRKLARPRNT